MTASSQRAGSESARGRCPICGAPADAEAKPFCSKRCADIDLARWLSGSYVIAGGQADGDQSAAQGAAGSAHREEDPDEGR